ncbi:unnamed protein product [Arabidopsis halleri]
MIDTMRFSVLVHIRFLEKLMSEICQVCRDATHLC